MQIQSWSRVLSAALGLAVVAAAGQLGVAYGLGIVRFARDFANDGLWSAQLTWIAWFAALAALAGAAAGSHFAARWGLDLRLGTRIGLAAAAGLGAAVTVPLAAVPARAAVLLRPTVSQPPLDAALAALLGVVVGILVAVLVLSVRLAAVSVTLLVGVVWLLALVSVAPSLPAGTSLPEIRLAVLDLPALTGAQSTVAVLSAPLLALLICGAISYAARTRGLPPLQTAIATAAAPGLLALIYLIGSPGTGDREVQTTPYAGALIAVAVGLLTSLLIGIVRMPTMGSAAVDGPALPGAGTVEPAGVGTGGHAIPGARTPDRETLGARTADPLLDAGGDPAPEPTAETWTGAPSVGTWPGLASPPAAERPTDPFAGLARPTDPPTRPTDPPARLGDPPTRPTDPPTRPSDPPTRPSDPLARADDPLARADNLLARANEALARATDPMAGPTPAATDRDSGAPRPPLDDPPSWSPDSWSVDIPSSSVGRPGTPSSRYLPETPLDPPAAPLTTQSDPPPGTPLAAPSDLTAHSEPSVASFEPPPRTRPRPFPTPRPKPSSATQPEPQSALPEPPAASRSEPLSTTPPTSWPPTAEALSPGASTAETLSGTVSAAGAVPSEADGSAPALADEPVKPKRSWLRRKKSRPAEQPAEPAAAATTDRDPGATAPASPPEPGQSAGTASWLGSADAADLDPFPDRRTTMPSPAEAALAFEAAVAPETTAAPEAPEAAAAAEATAASQAATVAESQPTVTKRSWRARRAERAARQAPAPEPSAPTSTEDEGRSPATTERATTERATTERTTTGWATAADPSERATATAAEPGGRATAGSDNLGTAAAIPAQAVPAGTAGAAAGDAADPPAATPDQTASEADAESRRGRRQHEDEHIDWISSLAGRDEEEARASAAGRRRLRRDRDQLTPPDDLSF